MSWSNVDVFDYKVKVIMKKSLVLVTLALMGGCSYAQNYVGAIAALSSLKIDCSSKDFCDTKGFGLKLYAGARLAADNQVDLGIAKIDAMEVGLINFGKASSRYAKEYLVPNPDTNAGGVVPQLRTVSTTGTANAITVAAIANTPLSDDIAFSLKFGVAYVSSTQRTYLDGVTDGGVTETKMQPYVGLMAKYNIAESIKLVGSYDWTRFDMAGRKSSLGALGLGAELSF